MHYALYGTTTKASTAPVEKKGAGIYQGDVELYQNFRSALDIRFERVKR
tara:strand:+ start:469 stop:615 length:147 start_codon:yes stop_codon:yes gene_type:complete